MATTGLPPPAEGGTGGSRAQRGTARRRCTARGCTNFARRTSAYCAAHKHVHPQAAEPIEAAPGEGETFAERMAREDGERRAAAAAQFRERLDAGDYRGLFGAQLTGLMSQAAAEAGVDDEIAILRIVMARLVAEEHDPVTLAKAISRVAAVSIQAARARRAINGQLAEGLTDAITSILAELDGGEL